MDVLGANNNNQVQYKIDKKVYYQFLNTPYDTVQISQQSPDQKQDKKKDRDLKQVANTLDPIKNYKKVSAKVAGIAGASALIMGLLLVSVLKGKSGTSERIGNILQKLRGQAYNLQSEPKTNSARLKYFVNTRLTKLLDGGLNTWINTDQLKNVFIDRKIIQKNGLIKKPFYSIVSIFRKAAQNRNMTFYQDAVKEADKLEQMAPDLIKAIKKNNNYIANEEILRLNKTFPGLNLNRGETRAQVAEKIINKIVKDTKELANTNNFAARQKNADNRLEDVVKAYAEQFEVLSDGKKGFLSSWKQAANKIKTSGKEIISRKNQQAFEDTKNEVYGAKELISRNIGDNYKTNIEILKEVENHVIEASRGNDKLVTKYTTSYSKHIRELEKAMKNYKDASTSAGQIRRTGSIEEYKNITKKLINDMKKDGYGTDEQIKMAIEKLNKSVDTIDAKDQKGMVQELRDILKCTDKNGVNTLKRDSSVVYDKFKDNTNKFSKKLNKASNFETDNLFYRNMDLKLGGGNFEVISFLVPIGMGAAHISKSDCHDEKVSKTIRTGSVIGGGIFGWLTSGVVLCLSGGQSMLFGLASGLAFDRVGELIDKKCWSKGRDWKEIKKQKMQETKAIEQQKLQQANAHTV